MEGFLGMLQFKVVFDFFHVYTRSKFFYKLFQDETKSIY